ncbi:MAG: hypothetical protein HKN37_17580 [Rhodothermales bacterium]|nr:hypothetical protein [Rhodothermales bacterium]
MTHTHFTPFSLALDFDEASERLDSHLYRRVRECRICRGALEELSRWLLALDHCDPIVGPEFTTRHDFFASLMTENLTHEDRLAALRSDELFHHWGLGRLLLEESRSCRESNPELSTELAELALTVAEHLDPGFYRPERVADAQAQAAANYGDALRLLHRLDVAKQQFTAAISYLANGTGRPRIASGVARLEARLLKDKGHHDEALDLLELAIAAYEERDEESRSLLHWMHESCGDRIEGEEITDGTTQNQTG